MTARSIRRAAERKAKKLARRGERNLVERPFQAAMTAFEPASQCSEHLCSDPEPASPASLSPAQLAANRANAQLSTGPTSETGKATSSLNAVKTGLTGRTVLLPSDDAAAYQAHIDRLFAQWQPYDDTERTLTQTLADTEWRLLRIPSLEMGIYALGRLEFKDKFAAEAEAARASLIEAHTFLTYRRDLNNLSIQEGRLLRIRDKTVNALEQVQEERRKRIDAQVKQAAHALQEAKRAGKPFDLAEFGFEISNEQVEAMILDWIASREHNSSVPLAAWEQQFGREASARKKAA